MSTIIYEPKGKAREYSELAVNLYTGCSHACKYCYCPAISYKKLEDFAKDPKPRADILKKLEADAAKMKGETRQVLFSFMSDPYQSDEAAALTREALLILEKYEFKNVSVLTKAGPRAVRDFDILARNGWKFGSTLIFTKEADREKWEPGTPALLDRARAIRKAHEMGIFTWVSIEPVIDPHQAIKVIQALRHDVDFWKVGKLNHFPEIEKQIDWRDFYEQVKKNIPEEKVYFKIDLLKAVEQKQGSSLILTLF